MFFKTLNQKCGFEPREASNMMGKDGFTYKTKSCSGSEALVARGDWIAIKGLHIIPGSLQTVSPRNDQGSCMSDHALISLDFEL